MPQRLASCVYAILKIVYCKSAFPKHSCLRFHFTIETEIPLFAANAVCCRGCN